MTERKDKIKNKAKVVRELAKNPESTQRETAKNTGLWLWTVNRANQELEQSGTESDIMDKILAMDDEIMDLANKITLEKLKEWLPKKEDGTIDIENLSLNQIKTIWELANNSTKRKAIFWKNDEWDSKVVFVIQ